MNESHCFQSAPIAYRMRVAGHLDQHWSAWFGGAAITHQSDGTTLLVGLLVDQAAVYGLLGTARDLHLTLLSFHLRSGTAHSAL